MTACNTERLIKALIDTELLSKHKTNSPGATRQSPYVVTVSRSHGSLGREVAHQLAERLGVRCCDREILIGVASRAKVDVDLVESLDRHIQSIKGEWWHGLFSGKTISRDLYYQNLVKVILSISQRGGVILGRGANLILGPFASFRIRVVGDFNRCVNRIMERDGLDKDTASNQVRMIDQEREDYIRVLYEQDIYDATKYDLSVNSDRLDTDAIVNLILFSMLKAGYSLPEDTVQFS